MWGGREMLDAPISPHKTPGWFQDWVESFLHGGEESQPPPGKVKASLCRLVTPFLLGQQEWDSGTIPHLGAAEPISPSPSTEARSAV